MRDYPPNNFYKYHLLEGGTFANPGFSLTASWLITTSQPPCISMTHIYYTISKSWGRATHLRPDRFVECFQNRHFAKKKKCRSYNLLFWAMCLGFQCHGKIDILSSLSLRCVQFTVRRISWPRSYPASYRDPEPKIGISWGLILALLSEVMLRSSF